MLEETTDAAGHVFLRRARNAIFARLEARGELLGIISVANKRRTKTWTGASLPVTLTAARSERT